MNHFSVDVKKLIAAKRAHAKSRGIKFKLGRVTRPVHPIRAERNYRRRLKPITAKLRSILKAMLPRFHQVMLEANRGRPSLDRFDGFGDDLRRVIEAGKIDFYSVFSNGVIKIQAQETAKEVNKFNATEFDKSLKQVLGVDVFQNEKWLSQEMDGFVADNVDLIKTIPDQFFSTIQQIVNDGARSGRTTDDIADELQDRVGITETRAAFIARDQVAKFNSDLTKLRQTSVGIRKYIWRTSLDERVRGNPDGLYPKADPSHWALEGQEFTWEEGPEETDGENPGEPFNCRCTAEAVFEEEGDDAPEEEPEADTSEE